MTKAFIGIVAVGLFSGCSETRLDSTDNLERLNAQVTALGDTGISVGDTCTRIHHLWRDQLRLSLVLSERPRRDRESTFLDSIFVPHQDFWTGYVGGERGFVREVADRWSDLERDPRAAIPVNHDVGGMIEEANRLAAALTSRPVPCADWYLLYGPGWANMGGLSTGEMLIDFFGFSDEQEDLRIYIPHEIAHVLYGKRPQDSQDGTLLSSILSEGFATYFSVVFHEGHLSPAAALGYSPEEWSWAELHEQQLWATASAELDSRNEDRIRMYRAAREHLLPGAPGKIGYFIGYRIVESYVSRHGRNSWIDFFELPLSELVARSGYHGSRVAP